MALKTGVDTGTKKRKERSKSDAILEAVAAMQKRMDEISDDIKGLKRRLKRIKEK